MGEALGELLPVAVAVAVSPIPIMAVILMLLAPRAGGASVGFLAGWVAGIVGATVVFWVLADMAGLESASGEPSAEESWIKLALGVGILVLAVRHWRERPRPGEPAGLPGWMKAIDKVTAARAMALGAGLSAVNPKNLMLCAAAGVTIAHAGLALGSDVVLVAVFTLVAACTVVAPAVAYRVAAERMRGPLDRLRAWLERDNATVMFVLLLVIGVVLAGKGIGGLIG
ncbi:GAP family protein [Actinomadura viridis]|uniref:Threonine/homoserine/homoserine lactone efflux protein n=1 Tax=Actinomadura viridis TaxID=58110 RepID=A0A931GNG7_9ACTN|nr:GAP family protein [Actinomadura viridis]MBG6089496.1 threonine/homoserine/homoserine lactone efflux protein [Actinomadura viridis]